MPTEPFRFVHASNLCLDHQLTDTGPLPAESHETVQDATFEAFDRVVTLCQDRRADLLLLTGNSFNQFDRSVRAQSALAAGLNRLSAQGIHVCLAAGELDPPLAWPNMGRLPEHVSLLSHRSDEPVKIERDGRVVATVQLLQDHFADAQRSEATLAGRRPFAIGMLTDSSAFDPDNTAEHVDNSASGAADGSLAESLLPKHLTECGVDYLALGGIQPRRTVALKSGMAHNPGSTQGLEPTQRGPHGCSLIDVNSNGHVDAKFIPTAPVRWETMYLRLDAATGRGDLLEKMRTALGQCRPESVEQIWLCHWTIQGFGPTFDSLYETLTRDEILGSLEAPGARTADLRMAHSVFLLPDSTAVESASLNDGFAHEYFERLGQPSVFSPQSLQERLSEAAIPEAAGSHRLQSLIAELDPDVMAGHAHRLGVTLFGINSEEGPPHEAYGHSHSEIRSLEGA